MPVRFHDDAWPLVRVVLTGTLGAPDVSAYNEALLSRMERASVRGERFAVVGDARECEPPGFEARQQLAAFIERHDAIARRTAIGGYWALSSPMQRAVLAVISWLVPLPIPVEGFATLTEAEAAAWNALAEERREASAI